MAFQGEQAATSSDCIPGAKYLIPKEDHINQSKLMQNVDFLGQGFQIPSFQGQNPDEMEKTLESTMGQVQGPSNGGGVLTHHPGYH